MKVLFISHSFKNSYIPLSGVFFAEQAFALKSQGFDLAIVAVNMISFKSIFKLKKIDFGYRKKTEGGIDAYVYQLPSIPYLKGFNRLIRNVFLKKLILRCISEHGMPDVSHVQVFYSGEAAMWLKRQHHIPFVITEHFSVFAQQLVSKNELRFAEKVFKNADCCIAVSEHFCKLLSEKFDVNFKFIPNVVDVDFFKIQNQNKNNETKQLLSVANFNPNKNHEMLIKAFGKLEGNLHLTLVGEGFTKPIMERLVNDLNLNNRVTFYGSAKSEELVNLLNKSDLFVHPSKYETFGVVLIEALSCGVPVVSTRCGGAESIIEADFLGELSDINEDDFIEKIKMALNKKYDSVLIRNHIIENYSALAFSTKIKMIYSEVLSKSRKQ